MSRPAVIVEDLGKSYRIGLKEERYPTFREALTHAVKSPLRRLRSLGERGTEDDIFWALRYVSFELQPGEVVGIIGRNGAGKSTLLKILSRITEPTEGHARLRGRVASLLEVGTGFHPELTGRENIYLNGSILGMKRAEIDRKFDEIVTFSEIAKFLDTPVKRYSSGMFVRLAFAVAAHLDPDILIVDEVLAVGDAEFQKKCLGKMKQVAGGGRTVVFVSHNMPAVIQLCEKAFMIKDGKMMISGKSDYVANYYMKNSYHNLDNNEVNDLGRLARNRTIKLNRRANLVSCRMTTPGKSGSWIIPYGSPLELEIELLATTLLSDVILGVAIVDSSDYIFASPWTSDEISSLSLCRGAYRIRLSMPDIRLTPGNYHLDLGLHSSLGTEDYINQAVSFEVVPNQLSVDTLVHRRAAPLAPKMLCRIDKLDKPALAECE